MRVSKPTWPEAYRFARPGPRPGPAAMPRTSTSQSGRRVLAAYFALNYAWLVAFVGV